MPEKLEQPAPDKEEIYPKDRRALREHNEKMRVLREKVSEAKSVADLKANFGDIESIFNELNIVSLFAQSKSYKELQRETEARTVRLANLMEIISEKDAKEAGESAEQYVKELREALVGEIDSTPKIFKKDKKEDEPREVPRTGELSLEVFESISDIHTFLNAAENASGEAEYITQWGASEDTDTKEKLTGAQLAEKIKTRISQWEKESFMRRPLAERRAVIVEFIQRVGGAEEKALRKALDRSLVKLPFFNEEPRPQSHEEKERVSDQEFKGVSDLGEFITLLRDRRAVQFSGRELSGSKMADNIAELVETWKGEKFQKQSRAMRQNAIDSLIDGLGEDAEGHIRGALERSLAPLKLLEEPLGTLSEEKLEEKKESGASKDEAITQKLEKYFDSVGTRQDFFKKIEELKARTHGSQREKGSVKREDLSRTLGQIQGELQEKFDYFESAAFLSRTEEEKKSEIQNYIESAPQGLRPVLSRVLERTGAQPLERRQAKEEKVSSTPIKSPLPTMEKKQPPLIAHFEKNKLPAYEFTMSKLNEPGFAEFLALYPDAESVDMNDTLRMQPRYEAFKAKGEAGEILKTVFQDEIKEALGFEISEEELGEVGTLLESRAIERPESIKEVYETARYYTELKTKISELETQAGRFGNLEGLRDEMHKLREKRSHVEMGKQASSVAAFFEKWIWGREAKRIKALLSETKEDDSEVKFLSTATEWRKEMEKRLETITHERNAAEFKKIRSELYGVEIGWLTNNEIDRELGLMDRYIKEAEEKIHTVEELNRMSAFFKEEFTEMRTSLVTGVIGMKEISELAQAKAEAKLKDLMKPEASLEALNDAASLYEKLIESQGKERGLRYTLGMNMEVLSKDIETKVENRVSADIIRELEKVSLSQKVSQRFDSIKSLLKKFTEQEFSMGRKKGSEATAAVVAILEKISKKLSKDDRVKMVLVRGYITELKKQKNA